MDYATGRLEFVADAVRATREYLRVTSPETLLGSTRSGIVPLNDRDRVSFTINRFLLRLCAVIACICLVMALLSVWERTLPWASFGLVHNYSLSARLLLGFGWVAAAVIVLIIAIYIEWMGAHAVANRRQAPLGFDRPEMVGIEPADTYNRLKINADDIGMLWHDIQGRRLLIDGLAHRYLVCAPDLLAIELGSVRQGSGVRLDLRIADNADLAIVVSSRHLSVHADELQPGEYDFRKSFARHIGKTLHIDAEAAH